MQPLAILLPDPEVLELKDVIVDPANQRLDIPVAAASPSAICPCCNQPSERIHSRSLRTRADLPWAGCAVRCGSALPSRSNYVPEYQPR